MITPYRERTFYSLSDWTVADHTLKPYGITVDDAGRLDPGLTNEALAFTQRVLPSAAGSEGGSDRLGYCVMHAGTVGTWLLIHWWAHHDICCQRLALAAPGTQHFESMDRRALLACVWEQVVMHHERDAWVRHMMSAAPDRDGYLRDRLPDGRY